MAGKNGSGRKSGKALSAVAALPRGPRAPGKLTAEQVELFNGVVRSSPEGWFDSQVLIDLLSDYARHRAFADQISAKMDEFPHEKLFKIEGRRALKDLSLMRDREVRACTSLATKLRLTNQSRRSPEVAATAHANRSVDPEGDDSLLPWEVDA